MAQLIKILDYVSRYENDLSHYTTQFIRLKRYQWDRLKLQWQNQKDGFFFEEEEEEIEEKPTLFQSIARRFKKAPEREEEVERVDEDILNQFDPFVPGSANSIEQLKRQYTEQLYDFQLKWASSTLLSRSTIHAKYRRDTLMKQFTQRLPDNFLMMYEPIIQIKKAPVEMNIILLTPVQCYTITVLEHEDVAAFIGGSERFWVKKYGEHEQKLLNPLIELSRNESILQQIFQEEEIELPIKKVLLSRNGYVDYPGVPFDTTIIDRRTFDEWFEQLRRQSTAPMKLAQYRAANRLLQLCQTTADSMLFPTEEEDVEESEEI